MRCIAGVVITLIAVMLVLSELGISIAPILASAGIVGLAIGFGAQSLVKDCFTGFFLLLENQVHQGDVVEVAGLGETIRSNPVVHVGLPMLRLLLVILLNLVFPLSNSGYPVNFQGGLSIEYG